MHPVLRRVAVGACIAVGGADAATLFVPMHGDVVGWAQDIVPIVAPLLAGAACIRAAVEALTVLIAAATLTATYVFLPTLRSMHDAAGAAALLAYPVGDLMLL